MAKLKCFDCKGEFTANERGTKRVPIKLCHSCVVRRVIFECKSCHETGCIKEGFYLCDCWDCKLEGCKRCIRNERYVSGIEFDFCEKHKDYDQKQLKIDAEDILSEEHDASEVQDE